MRRLIWSEAARDDLKEIRRYVGERRPAAARAMAKRIRDAVQHLRRHPEMGKAVIERPGLRELVIDRTPYVVGYRVRGDFHHAAHRDAPSRQSRRLPQRANDVCRIEHAGL